MTALESELDIIFNFIFNAFKPSTPLAAVEWACLHYWCILNRWPVQQSTFFPWDSICFSCSTWLILPWFSFLFQRVSEMWKNMHGIWSITKIYFMFSCERGWFILYCHDTGGIRHRKAIRRRCIPMRLSISFFPISVIVK